MQRTQSLGIVLSAIAAIALSAIPVTIQFSALGLGF
jgi:hypothetical protein